MCDLKPAISLLDQLICQKTAASGTPALVYALTDCDHTLHAAGYAQGVQQAESEQLLYEIGSAGKTFTAIAVLQAAEAGLLNLHDPVKAYLPWFQVNSKYTAITLHHLLTHTSGLVRGTEFSPDPRSAVWALRETETGFAPGELCSYSDAGFKILGLVLEAVYQLPYAEIIRKNIFEPLGMNNSYSVITHELRLQLAQGLKPLYDDRPRHSSYPLVPAPWLETNSGDGCMVSTVEDMARFVRMLLNRGRGPLGALLSESSFELMSTAWIEGDWNIWGSAGYGVYVLTENDHKHIAHGGDMPGFEAYFSADLDSGMGIVLLSAQPYPAGTIWKVIRTLEAAYLQNPLPEMEVVPAPAFVEDPAQFAGIYEAGERSVCFRAGENQIFLDWQNQAILLEKHGRYRFVAAHPEFNRYLFQFELSEGKVVAVTHGAYRYRRSGVPTPALPAVPGEWQGFVGHYRSYSPWESNFRVVLREGELLLIWPSGDEELLTPLGEACFRIGEDETSPERLCFDQVAQGQTLRVLHSGSPFYRFFTP